MIDSSNRFFWCYPLKPATLFSLIHIRASSKVNDDGKFLAWRVGLNFLFHWTAARNTPARNFLLAFRASYFGFIEAPFKWWRQLHCRYILVRLLFMSSLSGPEYKRNHNKSQFQIFFLRFYARLIYVAFLSFSWILNVKCKHLCQTFRYQVT